MKKIFYPAIKRDGAMVVGFNLPYDLTRCAVGWSRGGKGGRDKRKWSLEMSRYPNGLENKNFRRVIIEPLDSKKAFINLAPEWIPKGRKKEWKHEPRFLDLRTLLWGLYNRSFSLRNACDNKKGPFKEHNLPQKQDDGATGQVTSKEIEYARQDVRCYIFSDRCTTAHFHVRPARAPPRTSVQQAARLTS
jgi:hypothetical protein